MPEPLGEKTKYSEASQRTFERTLEMLEKKLDENRVAKLRVLLSESRIHNADLFVAALTGDGK